MTAPLISYAQNYEDIMLWRALGHVESGFYIDVGAAWPSHDSVTKLFSDRGWTGINVEPNPVLFALLVNQRKHDVNLQLALGETATTEQMNVVVDTGLSTLDQNIAEGYLADGREVEVVEVVVATLAQVWETYVPADTDVHFLKIDVEGFEEAVIRGNHWDIRRPWIVVVEATEPMTQRQSYDGWEPILLSADYSFVYADGINRFYLASEHADLGHFFQFPPNVFDSFVVSSLIDAEDRIVQEQVGAIQARDQLARAEFEVIRLKDSEAWLINLRNLDLERKLRAAETHRAAEAKIERLIKLVGEESIGHSEALRELEAAQVALRSAVERVAHLDRHIDSIHASHSWKLAAPARFLSKAVRALRTSNRRVSHLLLRTIIGPISRPVLARAIAIVRAHPSIERLARRILNHVPFLHRRFYQFGSTRGLTSTSSIADDPTTVLRLLAGDSANSMPTESAATRHVYRRLLAAISDRSASS